ncbi:MAG: hypothetical protein KJN99_14255 [Marinicaulis sp.]|nr:hypothetical protein [Marinicaulis sp.]
MRKFFLAAAVFALAACSQKTEAPAPVETPEPIGVSTAHELPSVGFSPTGIDFWTHPNVAFNALIIVAGADGIVSYNMEDGVEVSRVPGVNAHGAAVSYLGLGPTARGLLVSYDTEAEAFKVYAIDNVTRNFQPELGEIPVRGNVRSFCFGRAAGESSPSLFIVQKGELTSYDFGIEAENVKVSNMQSFTAPADATDCTVDPLTGEAIVVTQAGALYRFASEGAPSAITTLANVKPAGIGMIASASEGENGEAAFGAHVFLLGGETGAVAVIDAASGKVAGAASFAATDEIDAEGAPGVLGVSGANLGGLYRNGAVAVTFGSEAPALRLIPANGVANALGIETGDPIEPRGTLPEAEDDSLLIRTDFNLE